MIYTNHQIPIQDSYGTIVKHCVKFTKSSTNVTKVNRIKTIIVLQSNSLIFLILRLNLCDF